MPKNDVDQETAIYRVIDELCSVAAWVIANDYINGLKWDSDENGHYWQGESEGRYAHTVELVKDTKSVHAKFVLSTFDKLIEAHKINLKRSNNL